MPVRDGYVDKVRFPRVGRVPSKANYRHGRKGTNKAWAKIKEFEQDMQKHALVFGGKMREDCVVEIHVVLINQRVDADNANKAILDSLQGVYFKDDSKKYLRSIHIEHLPDDPELSPSLVIEVRWYERARRVYPKGTLLEAKVVPGGYRVLGKVGDD